MSESQIKSGRKKGFVVLFRSAAQDNRLSLEARGLFAFQYPHYGQKGFSESALARQQNPLEDKTISEITWDLLCVLHAFDYYKSGDIGEDAYREDVEHFKGKWCKPYSKKRTKEIVDTEVAALRAELYRDFGLEAPNAQT